jgi:hypothetical protein
MTDSLASNIHIEVRNPAGLLLIKLGAITQDFFDILTVEHNLVLSGYALCGAGLGRKSLG